MNNVLRIILIIAVLVLATLALLYVFGLLSMATLFANLKLIVIALPIVMATVVAIGLLSRPRETAGEA